MSGSPTKAFSNYSQANALHTLVASSELRRLVFGLIQRRLNRSKALMVLDPHQAPLHDPEPLSAEVFADTSSDDLVLSDAELMSLLIHDHQRALDLPAKHGLFVFSELFDEPPPQVLEVVSEVESPPLPSSPIKAVLPKVRPQTINTALANTQTPVTAIHAPVLLPDRLLGLLLLKLMLFKHKIDKASSSSSSNPQPSSSSPSNPPQPPLLQQGNRNSHQLSEESEHLRLPEPDILSTNTPYTTTAQARADTSTESLTNQSQSQPTNESVAPPLVFVNTSQPRLPLMLRFSTGTVESDGSGHSRRETVRSLMSLGELLTRLENYYEGDEQITHRLLLPPIPLGLKFSHEDLRGTEPDLTAGIVADSELPVTIYKVQDKDYDELTNRWLVYEHRTSQPQAEQPQKAESLDESLVHDTPRDPAVEVLPPAHPYTQATYPTSSVAEGLGLGLGLRLLGTPRTNRSLVAPALAAALAAAVAVLPQSGTTHGASSQNTAIGLTPKQLDPVSEIEVPPKAAYTSLSPALLTISLSLPAQTVPHPPPPPPPRLSVAKKTIANPQRSLVNFPEVPLTLVVLDHYSQHTLHERMFADEPGVSPFPIDLGSLEKAASSGYVEKPKFYSWGRWASMMVAALLIIPLFFMIPLGMLDVLPQATYNLAMFYSGHRGEKPVARKYSKSQKVALTVVGMGWIVIVLAMIGVGLGVGLTRN